MATVWVSRNHEGLEDYPGFYVVSSKRMRKCIWGGYKVGVWNVTVCDRVFEGLFPFKLEPGSAQKKAEIDLKLV